MGRGRGGYTQILLCYRDSGGYTVTDPGAVFIAERYMDQGYESVFRQTHPPSRTYDLSIKSSNDLGFIKNIEVKRITSSNPSKIASRIKQGFSQFPEGREDTVAIYLPNHNNTETSRAFAREGFYEAKRKGWVKGHVEIWFSDKTKIDME